MSLLVDNRENKIIKILADIPQFTDYSIQQLPIGDFIVNRNGEPYFVFERKSVNDLYQSINDGRYKEQKARLFSQFRANRIIYIVEGSLSELYSDSRKKAVTGSIFNMQFRDKITIVRTSNPVETAQFILSFLDKFAKNPDWFTVEAQQNNSAGPHHEEYSSLIKVNKSSNVTPEVCQIVMLTQIPGVSHNFSKKILQEYGNIEKLIYALKSHEKPEMLLADIKVTDKRKLGKVLSQRIFNYLIIIDSE